MCQHVVPDDEIGMPVLLADVTGRGGAEEPDKSGDASLGRRRGDVGRGIYAEDANAMTHEVLQQVTIVARDLHDEARVVEGETLDHGVDIRPSVLDPAVGIRRVVWVPVVEDLFGGDVLLQLHKKALVAHAWVEREERFRFVEMIGVGEGLAQWRHAEVHEAVLERCVAEPADAFSAGHGFASGSSTSPGGSSIRNASSSVTTASRGRARAGGAL